MALALVLGGCEAQEGSEPRSVVSLERQTLVVKQLDREQVSTRLTLRWQRDGRLDVVDAVEVPGFLKLEKNGSPPVWAKREEVCLLCHGKRMDRTISSQMGRSTSCRPHSQT